MKNKKAFTLIELLAVILILAVILAVVTPSVLSFLQSSKQKAYDTSINKIIEAARIYVASNIKDFKDIDYYEMSLDELCSSDYLDCPIINPKNDEELNGFIYLTKSGRTFEYEFVEN